jgi:hypothetical protein
MSNESHELTDQERAALAKLLEMNATQSTQHFTDLAATWGLGGVHHQLEELLGGLREQDRPAPAVALVGALADYLQSFGPAGVVGQSDTYREHP